MQRAASKASPASRSTSTARSTPIALLLGVRPPRHLALRELAGLSPPEASELLREWHIGGRGRDRGSVTALVESVGIDRAVWVEYLDSSWDVASLVRHDASLVAAVTVLDAVLPVVVVTNNSERNAARLLRSLGFPDGAFPIVAPNGARRPKPAADVFVESARRLTDSRPRCSPSATGGRSTSARCLSSAGAASKSKRRPTSSSSAKFWRPTSDEGGPATPLRSAAFPRSNIGRSNAHIRARSVARRP